MQYDFSGHDNQTPRSTARWLWDFLQARRKLTQPDGRALFEYRTTTEELEQLRLLLIDRFPRGTHDCAAFCLYAAEWWRRHGKGLTFAGLLESIELDVSYTRLYESIERGMKYWNRPLRYLESGGRGRRDFVGSLSREGGLPLQMLLETQGSVRRFFRRLLKERAIGEIDVEHAEIAAHDLPRAWHHPDIYELATKLITHVWDLRASIGESEHPVADLDRLQPGWQERLPVLVDDEVAVALVRGLVQDAQEIATGARLGLVVETQLSASEGDWQLRRVVELPTKIPSREMWKLLGLDSASEDKPRRVRLLIDDGSGPRPLVVATQWEIEKPFAAKPLLSGNYASPSPHELAVVAQARDLSFPPRILKGGEALDEGPWVFVSDEQDECQTGWKLVAQGSARVRATEVLVAVRDNFEPQTAELQPCGRIVVEGVLRLLFRLPRGSTEFLEIESDTRFVVEAAADEDDAYSYRTDGPLFGESLRPPVYQGIPAIIEESQFGVRRQVSPKELEWRPRDVGKDWGSLTNECIGHVELRLRRAATTIFSKSVRIVPSAMTVELSHAELPGSTQLRLHGTRAQQVQVQPHVGFDSTPESSGAHFGWTFTANDGAPPRIIIRLTWSMGRSLSLRLPFPNIGVRFVDRSSRVLPNGATIALENLPGCQLEAILPLGDIEPILEAKLKKARDRSPGFEDESRFLIRLRDATPTGTCSFRRHTLDLSRAVDDVRLRLASSTELNAYVRLRVQTRASCIEINVRRFAIAAMVNAESTDVIILRDKSETFVDDLLGEMEFSRIPITKPEAEAVTMVQSEVGWTVGDLTEDASAWLVVGRSQGRYRARPVIWKPPGISPSVPELSEITTLAEAVAIAWKDRRIAALEHILDTLAANPHHVEWAALLPFLYSLAELPASTYDLLDVMVRRPAICVYSLLGATARLDFRTLWESFEDLSFAWELVPVRAWVAGFQIWWAQQEAMVAKFPEEHHAMMRESLRSHMRRTLNAVHEQLHAFKLIRDLIEADLFELDLGPYLHMVSKGLGRKALLADRDNAHMDLLRTHANDPNWPVFRAIRELSESLPEQIPASFDSVARFKASPPRSRRCVVFAPVQAALAAVCDLSLTAEQIFAIRQIQAFDVDWFDHCYDISLACAIGITLEANPKSFQ
ncbi:hypothetical protein G6O69_06640 [Pseudenhygromyxa sp. WMMC2535]|uniref:STY4851/ECs_5259 family protein n=1 Tax=Pseudenhygromyxa sp. WMMC2535 TaxID=2712867 RepID=UPI00155680D9|nr:STY4851/ECs_5259 family protein [Pseudenhygromyxa sp. WMMC2535]NVB37503.1 hypothetical protein [Pseudenhygromyxa sp. WMMC2535]